MTRPTDATRIRAVILTTQRTGSTFLVQCLGSHPQIECASEILIGDPDVPAPPKYRGRFKELAKLANIARSGAWRPGNRMHRFFAGGQAKVRVFKVMYNQLANPFAIQFLRKNKDVRILHLRRYNLLKVHVSRLLMSKRDRVQATTPVEAVRIQVDPARALVGMRSALSRYERFEALFEAHMKLPLTYEDLIDGQFLQADTGRRICDFLEVAHHPMKSRLMKLNPESLRDMVINYDELAGAVSQTEFAGMLE
jgi:sulfotransferase family protein